MFREAVIRDGDGDGGLVGREAVLKSFFVKALSGRFDVIPYFLPLCVSCCSFSFSIGQDSIGKERFY